jgi:CheY-like chemotaxis protein
MATDLDTISQSGRDLRKISPGAPEMSLSETPRSGSEGAIDFTAEKRLRTLILDDSASTRRLLRAVLEHSERFSVVGEASDGRTGIAMAAALRPDLILLDLSMPLLDGASALREIVDVAPNATVVVMSGMPETTETAVLEAGASALLPKGLAPNEVIDRLVHLERGPLAYEHPGVSATIRLVP